MSDEIYPWPVDPSVLTPDVRLTVRQIWLGAVREVVPAVQTFETPVGTDVSGVGLTHAVIAKAHRLAFDALRISYELISQEEFVSRRDALPPMEVAA